MSRPNSKKYSGNKIEIKIEITYAFSNRILVWEPGRAVISTRTIREVLQDAGYEINRKKKENKEWNRFEASRPLELVQIDIAEFYIHKQRVYLVLLLDDYSRFLLGFRLIEPGNMEEIEGVVDEAISRYGKMEAIVSDRGFVFHG